MAMKYRYLIIDDEPLARKLIAAHASKIEGLEMAGECSNAIDAANFLRSNVVDLLFLDIQMPEVTGIQLAATLKNPPAVILTTAFRDYAPEAFELHAIDYLLKPISFERFLKAVNRFFDDHAVFDVNLIQSSKSEAAFIFLKADRKVHKIYCSDILYIESLDDYVKVYTKENVLITRENISTLEAKLKSFSFVRVHRSFIVNAVRVKTISNESIVVEGREIPFGRAFKKSAMSQLNLRL